MSKLLTESEVFPNIERTLGGKIVSSRRQGGRDAGGRPCWFIELRKGESVTPYYIRGDRGGDFGYIKEYGLQREARILQVLHAEGIPVPAVVATCDDPSFLVMEMVDGEADISTVSDAAEMDRIARHFAKVMADWHSIPVERFASVGLHVPLTSEELIGRDLDAWESGYHAMISQPVPLVTFACRWLRRNAPPMPDRLALLQGDTGPGQFLFRNGEISAVIDWETATIGDPIRDLAHMRSREAWYPTGNLSDWFRYYSEFSGVALDLERLRYYTVLSMLIPALALVPVAQHLNPQDDHCLWLTQDIWSRRVTAEALAEVEGVELTQIELPEVDSPRLRKLFDVLEQNLAEEQLPHIAAPFLRHRMGMSLQLLAHIRNVSFIGREIEQLELDDMQTLLGWRPKDMVQGQQAMDELVMRADADLDKALIGYFHRHAQREAALMQGAMGRGANAQVSPIVC